MLLAKALLLYIVLSSSESFVNTNGGKKIYDYETLFAFFNYKNLWWFWNKPIFYLKGISGKTWRKGLCKEEQGKTELKQLADDCRKTEGGCTKANCLALCYKSHGLKACEYFKPPQTRQNCVAFLYGVKKEPESNSDAFCYFTGIWKHWEASISFSIDLVF